MRKLGVKQVARQPIKDLPKLRLREPLPHVRGRSRGQARLWREAVRWFRIMAAKQGLYEAKECALRAEVKHIRQQAVPLRSTAHITRRSQSSILLLRHLWYRGGGWQPDHQAVRTAQDSFLLRKGLPTGSSSLPPVPSGHRSLPPAALQGRCRRLFRKAIAARIRDLLSSPAGKLTLAQLNCSTQATSLESTLSLSIDFS